MATEKRAEIAKHKTHKQQRAAWLLVVIVVVGVGVMNWQTEFWRDESIAKLEALIEQDKKARALLEELRAEVEELRKRIARDRHSP